MASENEVDVLNVIATDLNDSKQDIIAKKELYKVKQRFIQYYKQKNTLLQEVNKSDRKRVADQQKEKSDAQKRLAELRSVIKTLDSDKIKLSKSLSDSKEKNRKFREESNEVVMKYREKWQKRKEMYESKPLAIERKKLQKDVTNLEHKTMLKTNILKQLYKSKRLYDNIQKQRNRFNIINFASYINNLYTKQKLILNIMDDIKKIKQTIYSQQLIIKINKNEVQYSSLYRYLGISLKNLPNKLPFTEYNLPKPPKQIIHQQTEGANSYFVNPNTITSFVRVNTAQSLHFNNHPFDENVKSEKGLAIKQPKSVILSKINVTGENIKSQDRNDEYIKMKKVEVLENVMLKPEETTQILQEIKINMQNANNIKMVNSDNIIFPQATTVKSLTPVATMESSDVSRDNNCWFPNKNAGVDNMRKPNISNEREIKRIKLDLTPTYDEQINNSTNATKIDSNIEEKYAISFYEKEEKNQDESLMLNLKEECRMIVSPEFVYGQNIHLKQKILQPSTPLVSKYFSNTNNYDTPVEEVKNDSTNNDLKSSPAEIAQSHVENTVEQIQVETVLNGKQSSEKMSTENHAVLSPKDATTDINVYSTQNTFLNTYPTSITSPTYSEFSDNSCLTETDTYVLNEQDNDKMISGEMINVRNKQEIKGTHNFESGSFTFSLFGDHSGQEKMKATNEKEPSCSGFNFLFNKSDKKTKGGGGFFNLFN